jgi:endonuclease-3
MAADIKKFSETEITQILDILEEMYPNADCELDFQDTFQLLISVVLSAQTTDKHVNAVTPLLFARYPGPAELAAAEQEEVVGIIKSIGLYQNKSKNIIALSRKLMDLHGGNVPGTYEELTALPGVGRKSANVVLSNGFGVQRIAVDTHVFRVANRIGLADAKDVLKTELALMEILPEDRWSRTHHSLIWHGRRTCYARKPSCETCGLVGLCRFVLIKE